MVAEGGWGTLLRAAISGLLEPEPKLDMFGRAGCGLGRAGCGRAMPELFIGREPIFGAVDGVGLMPPGLPRFSKPPALGGRGTERMPIPPRSTLGLDCGMRFMPAFGAIGRSG
jgi:hypothetical protein